MKSGGIKRKIKNKVMSITKNLVLFKVGCFIRYFLKRPIPGDSDGKTLIHIGCGEFDDPRYINVDIRLGWHIHFAGTIEDCSKLFLPEYADLIYACHVLEHVSHLKLSATLKGLYECLKKGGILRISVPDFNTIVDMYKESQSIDSIMMPLMGGQDYRSNFHFSVFNKSYLTEILSKSGFKEVREWNPDNAPYHNFNDWSKRKITLSDKEYAISLNIEAIK